MIDLFYDWVNIVYINAMHKIEPLQDHLSLARIPIGEQVQYKGKPYKILQRTTLASGEPALVLQDNEKQFVIGATLLLADVEELESA